MARIPKSLCASRHSSKNKDYILNKKLKRASRNLDKWRSELQEMNSRVAIRFLVKKAKRFDEWKEQQAHSRSKQAKTKVPSSPDCLMYLGLAPKPRRACTKESEGPENFLFAKPRVYECCYCTKMYFHKLFYKRHMMRHLKIHWCVRCNRGFMSKDAKKRHDTACR